MSTVVCNRRLCTLYSCRKRSDCFWVPFHEPPVCTFCFGFEANQSLPKIHSACSGANFKTNYLQRSLFPSKFLSARHSQSQMEREERLFPQALSVASSAENIFWSQHCRDCSTFAFQAVSSPVQIMYIFRCLFYHLQPSPHICTLRSNFSSWQRQQIDCSTKSIDLELAFCSFSGREEACRIWKRKHALQFSQRITSNIYCVYRPVIELLLSKL